MKYFLLLSVFSTTAFAFPGSDLHFTCPNTFSNTTVTISLKWTAPEAKWLGVLSETSAIKSIQSLEISARYLEKNNRMEISHSGSIIALMTQINANQSLLKNGQSVLVCNF